MGDELAVDLVTGDINNLTKRRTFHAKPYPDFMMEIIKKGGLIPYTNTRLGVRRQDHARKIDS
jgi:3-isopropylmalate/(R)-2-methylmalate dehydratase small subunit